VSPRCVLIVEDNPLTRKMLRVTLESDGYHVLEAEDQQSAQAAAAQRPDLVVLDYMLPDVNGLQLLKELRETTGSPALPALLVTGMVSRLEELRTEAGPHTQVVAKPVEPPLLLEFVHAQLALAAPREAARGRSVLVVDDEPLNLKLAALQLQQSGYDVQTAGSGAEGLAKAQARPPDAILADVLMPGMDGFAFCLAVRRDPLIAHVPVVLASAAYVEDADQQLAKMAGASALVLRTEDFAEARAALERSLGSATSAPVPDTALDALHRDRLQVQLERQTARNDALVRQAAIQATALSVIRGLSEALRQPEEAAKMVGDVLVHCLDATGLSTGLLYLLGADGRYHLDAQFGIPVERRGDAEGVFGHADLLRGIADSGQPAAFSFGSLDSGGEGRTFLSHLGNASALLVPFVVLGRSFGVLLLASDSHDLSESAWTGFARSLAAQFGQTVALGQSLTRLATSESRLRALMQEANDTILILDLHDHILEANRAAETLLARPRQEIVGRRYDDFVVAEEVADSARVRRTLLEQGTIRVEERHLRRADGNAVPVEVSASLVRVSLTTDEPVILAIVRDISERVKAAAALQSAQAHLAHVVSSSPAVLYALGWGDPTAGGLLLTWISPNVEHLLGYTVPEALASDWWVDRLHPEDAPRVFQELGGFPKRDFVQHEYRFRHKDGGYRWMGAELRLIRGPSGEPVEVVGSWSDVTARKDAERRLQESEEQYRLLFDSNPHPMWVYDAETLAFLAVNEAAVRHYGYSRKELLAMAIVDIRPPEDVPALLQRVREVGGDAGPLRQAGLYRHRTKDGRTIQVEISSHDIQFEARSARLVLAVDVTEKLSLEAQLQQAQKMESIGRLAGGVAHDFNNLLGVITGYGELLRRRVKQDPTLHKYADDVLAAAHRAAGLTRQLLAFSRKQVLQPRVLDLNGVVADMERMLRRLIGEDIRMVTALAGEVPVIKADPGQLEQVLMNLVVNARDAMPKGGRLILETDRVDVDATYAARHAEFRPGPYAMLVVSDTGHGMPPDVQAHIFEPFFTTKEAGKGTGLGLATVHGIVKQSGGHIFVYSEPGRGTTFKVYLPAVEEPARTPAEADDDDDLPRGTETVLLVEDEAALREILQESLASCGYEVMSAPHGLAAMEVAERHQGPIHLLMTDVVMPGVGGREIAQQLSALRPDIRVLYMSGYTDDAVIVHGVLTADMPFLEKPFTAASLARKVRAVLDAGR
jgi:two-component system, cell cycle sensor histidine kinase and response regulator CckA